MDITIGEFIQDHLEAIVSKCQESHDYVIKLTDLEYSRKTFGISFPFMANRNKIEQENLGVRYWSKRYDIDQISYRFCSQFGGSDIIDGKTKSQYQGEKFLFFLKNNKIDLKQEYSGENINFIVGGNNVALSDSDDNTDQTSDNLQYWLIPCNPSNYDVIAAFTDHEEIDWRNPSNNNFKLGDIVYIYVSDKLKKIKIKAEVTMVGYGADKLLSGLEKYSILNSEPINNYFRIKRIKIFNDEESDRLSLENLKKNGLKGNIQGKMMLKEELLKYVKSIEDHNTHTHQLNTILFGPPGTGKTYNTINHALQIIEPNCSLNDRKELTKKFQNYVNSGQIVFTTFHQSYGYEEFIEGIKPDMDDSENGEIRYKVEDGVFKLLCETAISKSVESNTSTFDKDKNKVWKFSLGSSQNGEDELYYQEAVDTHSIILGWGDKIDFSSCSTYDAILEKANKNLSTARFVNIFIHEMKVGDIAIISHGNRAFKAIVEIVGDYFYDAESDLPQKREIKWLKRFDTPRPYSDVSDKYFTQATINRPNHINFDKLKHLLIGKEVDNSKKNFVIIIDEINRGNISKIFGELITLIEPSKRIDAAEALRVSLPYSGNKFDGGKGFGVPKNVYIIGTMNTADRSIALMDTALRRRFEFIEMMPNYDVLRDLKVDDIEIDKLLKVINDRISYLYDRAHKIGHAYFIGVKTIDDLNSVFKNKIIPLLQEYFYDDWEKIQMVLGDHKQQGANDADKFILSLKAEEKELFGFNHNDIENEKLAYLVNDEEFTPKAYLKITNAQIR